MFTVDVEFKSGVCIKPQFLTQREAVAYAGRMAQDSAVKRSEVRELGQDAKDGGPGSGPNPGGGSGVVGGKGESSRAAESAKKLSAAKERLAGIQSGNISTIKGPLGTYKISSEKGPYRVTKEQAIRSAKQALSDAKEEHRINSSVSKRGSATF